MTKIKVVEMTPERARRLNDADEAVIRVLMDKTESVFEALIVLKHVADFLRDTAGIVSEAVEVVAPDKADA